MDETTCAVLSKWIANQMVKAGQLAEQFIPQFIAGFAEKLGYGGTMAAANARTANPAGHYNMGIPGSPGASQQTNLQADAIARGDLQPESVKMTPGGRAKSILDSVPKGGQATAGVSTAYKTPAAQQAQARATHAAATKAPWRPAIKISEDFSGARALMKLME